IEGVRARLPAIERSVPRSVRLSIVRDDSKFIYASVASLKEHLIFGSLFAAIVVMFFIRNTRAVFISALAIPASIISSFTLMLVSFTLTPMLSSRFLKLSDAIADHKTKERGFFHWLDGWYSRQVRWALDHSGVVIAVATVTFLMTFPLNRLVGRDFVPNEDMG